MKAVFAKYETWISSTVMLNKGEAWDAEDPIVRTHPEAFQDFPPDVRTSIPGKPGNLLPWGERVRIVEDASADPGRVRTVPKSGVSRQVAESA
jgi:hypothetical protein